MPRIIIELLSLEDAVGSLKDFQTKVGKVPEQEELDWSIDGFFPHAQGYEHTLSDGVITNLRLNGRQTGFELEWCLANRDIEIPEEFDIEKAQDRLFDAFKWHPILLECSVFCSRSHVLHLKRSHALHPPEPRASTPTGATCFTTCPPFCPYGHSAVPRWSHRKLVLTEDAQSSFDSYAAYFNIMVDKAREANDVESGVFVKNIYI